MKKSIIAGMLVLVSGCFVACDDVFEPVVENNLPIDFLEQNSSYAENLLGVAYTYLANSTGYAMNEPATDDAVSNDAGNSWRQIAEGRWTSSNNPANRWENCRSGIQYCNLFLANVERVTWAKDEEANKLFHDRFIGEAYGLRAFHMFLLLQAHAGKDNAGELLGIPLVTEPEGEGSDFNLPRNTLKECLAAMNSDIEMALKYLPEEYGSSYFENLRDRYPGVSAGNLERVFGEKFKGRMCGRILEGVKARASLMAASPAFEESGVTWAQAAEDNAKVLSHVGGVEGLDPTGAAWYSDSAIENYASGQCPPEVMWRSELVNNNDLEKEHFPPTLYGSGRMNPTQNLVDAFPMANGYPISDSNSGYNESDPYAGRDPRLSLYILYNGMKAGHENTVIYTAADGTTNDGLGKISTSTRTGYYMKKLLNQNVSCNSASQVNRKHYTARMRYTEFFLNYAEAANEAWGPMGTGTSGYSAYDVIKEIRHRAGVGLENDDAYLESIKGDKDAMRALIRNERRLELCFEGFRFFDLRRWKSELNETAKGVSIENGVFNVINVESRNFREYMIYCPIPNSEVLKYSNLKQNAGW